MKTTANSYSTAPPPTARRGAESPAAAVPDGTTDSPLRGRILVAEDARASQRLLTFQLEGAGMEVKVAENGRIAVEMAKTEPFDLILMDIEMPEMDGCPATRELRRCGFALPIIALTAYSMAEDRIKCLASGCSDYLCKPVDESTLLRTVAQHLGQNIRSELPGSSEAALDEGGTIFSSVRDEPGMRDVVDDYVEGLPDDIASLAQLMDKDLQSLQRAVHQIRGVAGGYGFDIITELAGQAEDSIRAGEQRESVVRQIYSLIDAIRRVDGFGKSEITSD